MRRITIWLAYLKKSLVEYCSFFPSVIARYVSIKFTFTCLITVSALTGLISLFDFIDLLRRASSHPDVGLWVVLFIAGFHTPYYLIYVLPFGILLGGMTCFARLSRSSELTVIRASGISTWQFLSYPVMCALLLGCLSSMCLSPLSSSTYRQANFLDETFLQKGHDSLLLHNGSLWLRQKDNTLVPHGESIFHIKNLHLSHDTLYVEHTSIFRLDEHFHLLSRIETPSGTLRAHQWQFPHASELRPARLTHTITDMTLPSDLTIERIRSSTIPPDTLSLWALPDYITLLSRSGFSTIQYRLHFQALLALPILTGAMALVSAGFSMRPTRRGGIARMLGTGIVIGFALFTISKIAEQLGKSGAIPPLLASWAPTGASLCLAAALLLHMEDS